MQSKSGWYCMLCSALLCAALLCCTVLCSALLCFSALLLHSALLIMYIPDWELRDEMSTSTRRMKTHICVINYMWSFLSSINSSLIQLTWMTNVNESKRWDGNDGYTTNVPRSLKTSGQFKLMNECPIDEWIQVHDILNCSIYFRFTLRCLPYALQREVPSGRASGTETWHWKQRKSTWKPSGLRRFCWYKMRPACFQAWCSTGLCAADKTYMTWNLESIITSENSSVICQSCSSPATSYKSNPPTMSLADDLTALKEAGRNIHPEHA